VVPYAVSGGDPGAGFTPTVRDTTGAKAPAADVSAAVAAAGASALEKRRGRRRRGASVKERGHRDEYMDMDADTGPAEPPAAQPTPHLSASTRGAGAMGFSGTAAEADAKAAGLVEMKGDPFGGGPVDPLLPGGWSAGDPEGGERT
jgi:hypothetical protein